MATKTAQQRILDNDLIEEQMKQTALNHFYSFYVRHDLRDAMEYVSENIHWIGSREHFVAHNRSEFENLLSRELSDTPYDCIVKVVQIEAYTMGMNFYAVNGELEVRIPYKEKVLYTNLRFSMTLTIQEERCQIVSLHTSVSGENPFMENTIEKRSLIQMNSDMNNQEQFDSLTGLLTLDTFKVQTKSLLQSGIIEEKYALICTDVSHFEKVNNLYGLQKADKILSDLATILTTFSRDVRLCCRSVADHFLVLISYSDVERLNAVLKNLCSEFEEQITGRYVEASPKLGIGVYLISNPSLRIERMVEFANAARKSLRFEKKTRIAFYDEKTFMHMEKVRRIEKNMKDALANGEFKAFLQPKYSLETGKIVGAEALTRWIRPDGSMVYPDEFIPIFEKNGFIAQLDFFILAQVCRMIYRRLRNKKECVPISINQSRILLQDKNYVSKVAGVLAKYNTPPKYIELELTESIFRDDLSDIAQTMKKLKAFGIRWSIDDFGTGYSSLNLLKELPVDIIKIDKSFLDETESSEASKIIIRKTVELTQELEKKVVCEGVETELQADYLRNIQCDIAQGYLYAKPMKMSQFEELLDEEM